MHSLFLTVSIAILTVLATALPRPPPVSIPLRKRASLTGIDGSFDLERGLLHLAFTEAKISSGFRTLAKNSNPVATPPRDIRRRDSGSIPLADGNNNMLWYGTISVVDFDTGSADLILPGADCSTCSGHTLYNPNASSTAVDRNATFMLSYGDGSGVQGEQYMDTVVVAGLTAVGQAFGLASQYSSTLQASTFPPDGLMGMAFEGLSIYGANPVVQTLIANNVISDPIFAFKISSSGSELRIGDINSALYSGSLTYTPVTNPGFWLIQGDSININGNPAITQFTTIVDTGTTLILGDQTRVGQFYSGLNATDLGNGFYTLPCNSMPSVSITIEGTVFPLSSSTFNFGAYPTGSDQCVGAVAGTGSLGRGTHAGGLTANALVILASGTYLELISFTHPASHYPPGSPDRQKREGNPWAHKDPGWIDYAFLGSSDRSISISRIINERAQAEGSDAHYCPEVDGGRIRQDGKVLKWVISSPAQASEDEAGNRGVLPFFCGDMTPRKWRVPLDPPSNAQHSSGVRGVAHVRVLTGRESLERCAAKLTSVVGDPPAEVRTSSSLEYTWLLETPASGLGVVSTPRLVLSAPRNLEEDAYLDERGPGIYEVAFWTKPGGKEGVSATPFGRIIWQGLPS
ncbi:hypothetical protein ID866_9372 [Astraeus odoratus]|nr:hypothetical protein ID866_9372 [Astraeus odoratus]